jgi:D-alanyl-D-alanine carboxypeptidase
MNKYRYSLIAASLICASIASLISGCSDPNPPPVKQVTKQVQDSDPVLDSSKEPNEEPEKPSPQAIQLSSNKLTLAPGSEASLEVEILDENNTPMAYDSTELKFINTAENPEDILTVDPSGQITVSEQAEIGEEYTIKVQYMNLNETCEITIKYALEATVSMDEGDLPIVTNPESKAVVVNKQRGLPADYVPDDLVKPDIPFSFEGESEKKYLRKEAAEALEQLFAKAEKDGIQLFGVSGYRSYDTQSSIYFYNVKTRGEEETKRFSAYPGQSEHQTGLAIDISSRSADLSLEQLFGQTEEGQWLASNAAEFGFIIRYLEGKEHITGYAYEPWHIRYVGRIIAKEIMEQNLTLEEYFQDTIPVNG